MRPNEWNDLIAQLPEAHLLQTYEWGQVKARYGWQPLYLVWRRGSNGLELIEVLDFHATVSQPEQNSADFSFG